MYMQETHSKEQEAKNMKIIEMVGTVVNNDGKALKELLSGCHEPGTMRHTGNFAFEAQTPNGKRMVIITEPTDYEEQDKIRIKNISIS